jgi:endonuclease/exonuclease/phosphatase (EEP) superfamily protein YafD
LKILILIVGLLAIAATLLPITRRDEWWIRMWDFPRLQVTAMLALCAAGHLYFSEHTLPEIAFVSFLSFSLAYQGYMMFPYTPLARKQVQKSPRADHDSTICLLFANVLQSNRNSKKLREIIRNTDPDIILTVETDLWWQAELKEFESTHPFIVHEPLDNTYGMLLYSRLEFTEAEVRYLITDDVPSIHACVRLPSGIEVNLACLHPRPPFPTEDESSTQRDAELLVVGRMIKAKDRPFIVFGDLNDVAWSRTNYLFQDISGLLDPRKGRGFYNTFHARIPVIRFPLDHCFHTNHFRLVDFRRLDRFGSDHFPVSIKLSYEPEAVIEQEEPEPEPEQLDEAKEKISRVFP